MSALTDRMQEIDEGARDGATYHQRLIEHAGGGLASAAILDLTIDGNYWYTDLRRAPFAGNDELKDLYRIAASAQRDLSDRLLNIAWHGTAEEVTR